MKKQRAYLGPANTAGVFIDLERSLRSVGVSAEFVPWSSGQHGFFKRTGSNFRLIPWTTKKQLGVNAFFFFNEYILKPIYFAYAVFRYDAFFFIKPTTFFRNNWDLKVLKWFNRKIFFLYVGCNDRNPSFSNRDHWICKHCTDRLKQQHNLCHIPAQKAARANFFAQYADQVFGFADNVEFIAPKGKRLGLGMPPIVFRAHDKTETGKFKILHLPSNPMMKGTSLILPVLEKLKTRSDVEVVVKEGFWPREQMLDALREGHILIDSLVEYTFGKMSLEALQYGCLPLNAYPEWIADYYEEPVVVPVSADTLEDTLISLIEDHSKWQTTLTQKQIVYENEFSDEVVGAYYARECGLNMNL